MKKLLLIAAISSLSIAAAGLTACSSGGGGGYRSHTSYGVGYGGYYGSRPWGYYPGYVGGGPIDPDWGVGHGGPEAAQLPEMGMPDMGGMDSMDMGMGMDMGGFDF